MKKAVSLILAALLIFLAVPAMAGPLDGYSTAELQTLSAMIQAEILTRAGEPFTVLPGVYQVGRDIPAGSWRVEMRDETGTGILEVYRNYAEYADDFPVPLQEYTLTHIDGLGARVLGSVFLAEGMILQVDLPVVFSPFLGVGR